MKTLADVEPIVRSLINDISQLNKDVFVYSSSNLFTLTEKNPLDIISVSVNDESSGVEYIYDSSIAKIRIIAPELIESDVIDVDYNSYPNFSAFEINSYIKSAFVHLSVNKIKSFSVGEGDAITPEPSDDEINLIALIASILIDPKNISFKMPDITITLPKELTLNQKIQQVISSYKKASLVGDMFLAG